MLARERRDTPPNHHRACSGAPVQRPQHTSNTKDAPAHRLHCAGSTQGSIAFLQGSEPQARSLFIAPPPSPQSCFVSAQALQHSKRTHDTGRSKEGDGTRAQRSECKIGSCVDGCVLRPEASVIVAFRIAVDHTVDDCISIPLNVDRMRMRWRTSAHAIARD